MASNPPKSRRLSPQRLYLAEQRAAQAYKKSVTDTYATSFNPSSMKPPKYLRQMERASAYNPGFTSVHRGRTSMHRAAARSRHAIAPVQQIQQVVNAHHNDQGTFIHYEEYHGTKAHAAGYLARSHVTGWEIQSNHRNHSQEIPDELSGSHAELIDDHTLRGSSQGYKQALNTRDAQARAFARHYNTPQELEPVENHRRAIEVVNNGDKVDYRDGEIDLELSRSFTSRTRAQDILVPMVLPIRIPLLFTPQTSPKYQCEDSPTDSELEGVPIDILTTDGSVTSYQKTSYFHNSAPDPSTCISNLDIVAEMSHQAEQAVDHQSKQLPNKISQDPNPMATASGAVPDTKRWSMVSDVEKKQGILRTTSDGHLGGTIIEEETGDIISLNKPDDVAQRHYEETHKLAPVKRINAPEAKNGGTGADNPRARKSVHRVIKNWVTGSNRLPQDEPLKIFQVGDREPGRVNFEEMIKTRRHQGGTDTRYIMQKIIKRFWGGEVIKRFGQDWVGRADSHELYMQELEDFVLALTKDKSKPETEEEISEASQTAEAIGDDPQKKAKSGNSWWW